MTYLIDLHSHTVASTHAYSTLLECVAEAKKKGLLLFANTDHGPAMEDAPHYWHFVNLRVVPRFIDGVGILRGVEANILNEAGETDALGRVSESLDIVLAGFHEPVFRPQTREINTRAMVNTIKSGKVDIITHPGNTAFPIDIEAVVRAAVEFNVALEVNNSSFQQSRKGSKPNCRAIVEAARDLGATLSIGSDAHLACHIGNFSEADELIQEAGFPVERLLNSSPRRLFTFLEARGHTPIPEFASL